MESPKNLTLSYVLFMYREQLRQNGTEALRLNRTKLTLTDKLISKTSPHIDTCSMEDVRAVSRELIFRKKLKQQINQRLKKNLEKTSPKAVDEKKKCAD